MFNNVIAGVDGFDGGRDAIALAQALGPDRLTLVGVPPHDPQRFRGSVAGYERLIREDMVRALEAARMQAQAEAEIVAVGDNSPARALQHIAEERGADLLVVGAAHHSPVGRVLLGDVGRSIMHHAPCAVAVAPKHLTAAAPRTVAVGFDGSPEARAALESARRWSEEHRAVLSVWIAWETPTIAVPFGMAADLEHVEANGRAWADDLLAETLEDLSATTAGHVVHGRAAFELGKVAETVDLLIVGSRGWGPWSRVALGSTSHWLTHHAACPVIVVPRPAESNDEAEAGTLVEAAAGD
jgi:nucleotide-binding universal stress UspA family protein